jgi:DNA-binding CsgD family transcriptional regulator
MGEFQKVRVAQLSLRQRECLDLVGQGLTSKQIGRELGLSPSTVDNHIRSALERLGVSDRMSAVRSIADLDRELGGGAPGNLPQKDTLNLGALPPIGGRSNELNMHRRVWHIVQIALIAIMGMAAAVVTIAGLVRLFNP